MLTRSWIFLSCLILQTLLHILFLWQFWNITFDLVTHGNVLPFCFGGCVSGPLGSLEMPWCLNEMWTYHFDVPGFQALAFQCCYMLLSPEISTLENCKRSKSVWRFYQSKRIILRTRQWFSSMMFYDVLWFRWCCSFHANSEYGN